MDGWWWVVVGDSFVDTGDIHIYYTDLSRHIPTRLTTGERFTLRLTFVTSTNILVTNKPNRQSKHLDMGFYWSNIYNYCTFLAPCNPLKTYLRYCQVSEYILSVSFNRDDTWGIHICGHWVNKIWDFDDLYINMDRVSNLLGNSIAG